MAMVDSDQEDPLALTLISLRRADACSPASYQDTMNDVLMIHPSLR